jgi:hypothetical protein
MHRCTTKCAGMWYIQVRAALVVVTDFTGTMVHIEGSAKLDTGSCQRLSVVPSETDQDQLSLALLITLPGPKRCLVTVVYRALYDALQRIEARDGSPHT